MSNPHISPSEAVELMPSLRISHELINEALSLAAAVNQYQGPSKKAYFDKQAEDFAQVVGTIDGVSGSFGTGYPFYADDGETICPIDELDRYIGSYGLLARADRQLGRSTWPCACCTEANDMQDLKTICKPCDQVAIKPRDVFKALPDVDFWVVVDETQRNPEELSQELVGRLEDNGFYNSDRNHPSVLKSTIKATQGILQGEVPDTRLPLDLHVVTASEFVQAVCTVPKGLKDGNPTEISPLSWHRKWESDETYDFTKDFVFSLTPFRNFDPTLVAIVDSVRRSVARIIEEPIDLVGQLDDKDARKLRTPAVARLLVERLSSW